MTPAEMEREFWRKQEELKRGNDALRALDPEAADNFARLADSLATLMRSTRPAKSWRMHVLVALSILAGLLLGALLLSPS